jgi:hypothetical protein
MKYSTTLTIIGFLLFVFGLLALILSMIGIQFTMLKWIDAPGRMVGLVIRLVMIFGGIVLVYVSRVNPNE